MRKALILFGIVLLAGILLGSGYFLGSSHSLFKHMWVGSSLTEYTTKAAILSMRLRLIEESRIEDLKSGLNLELDGCVLYLTELIDWNEPTDADRVAIRALAGIAMQRSASRQTNMLAQAEAMIRGGLDKAVNYQNNK